MKKIILKKLTNFYQGNHQGFKSGLYGGCGKCSHFWSFRYFVVSTAVCALALSIKIIGSPILNFIMAGLTKSSRNETNDEAFMVWWKPR